MAIQRVCESSRTSQTWAVLVLLDVKNAFNTASWEVIMQKLRDREVPPYLFNLIGAYLQDRKIVAGKSQMIVTAGVPQGSVLGPTLWNILYDDVLRLRLPEGVQTTAYADDLAVTIVARDIPSLNRKAQTALDGIADWMEEHHLNLAPGKTVAVVLKGPYKREAMDLRLRGRKVEVVKEAKYLGVTIDSQGYFGKHVVGIVEKAERRLAALSCLMPNIGGPSYYRRRVYLAVVHSTILYAAPVWQRALRIERYRNLLVAVQRKALLRLGSAYKTVSAMAIQAITGVAPIDLLVQERCRTWGNLETPPQSLREARKETLRRWQERWTSNEAVAQWTKRLIPDLSQWVDCGHRRTDYFLTQFLSGHGSFRVFTKKIARDAVDTCRYCGERDSPEHTIFMCGRWEQIRIVRWGDFRGLLSPDNIIAHMTSERAHWDTITTAIREIMRRKEVEERSFQGGNPPP